MKMILDIHRLFVKKEGKILIGKRCGNFLILITILIISLLSISFAKSSRIYLSERMENPFVTWMDIETDQNSAEGRMSLLDFLEDKEVQDSCSFGIPIPTFTHNSYFYSKNQERQIQFTGRSFDAHTSLLDKILSPQNVIVKRNGCFRNDSIGIVVTQESLIELGYSIDTIPDFLYIGQRPVGGQCPQDSCKKWHYRLKEGYIPVAIPVLAVVKEIPGVQYSFLFSHEFYNIIYDDNVWNVLKKSHNIELKLYGKKDVLESISKSLEEKFSDYYVDIKFEPDFASWNANVGYIEISQAILQDTEEVCFFNDIYNELKDSGIDVNRIYQFNAENTYFGEIPLYSIEILNLKNVRILQDAIKRECNKRLDMRSVESQENFYYVEMMSNVLSWSIVSISVIFIFVFIYFMLYTHFQKIQKNLGTFKAFGFSNKTLYRIYVGLIVGIVVSAFTISMVILAIIQFILHLFNVGMMYSDTTYPIFDVFTIHTIYLFIIILFATITSTCIVTYLKFRHTPGDLIYNRNQQ